MTSEGPFELIPQSAEIPTHPEIPTLIQLAKALHEVGLMPPYGSGDHGNLSFRTSDGFVITARQTRKASLYPDQLVRVAACTRIPTGIRVAFDGHAMPSTDAPMHGMLYQRRPDIGVIVHGHDVQTLVKAPTLELPMTQTSARVASLELVEEVVSLAATYDYILMRDHGFVALGRSFQSANELVMHWFYRARAVS